MNDYYINTLLARVTDNMAVYRAELLQMPPTKILDNAFRYAAYQSIIASIPLAQLSTEALKALCDEPYPLASLYDHWLKLDSGYCDDFIAAIKGYANDAINRKNEPAS